MFLTYIHYPVNYLSTTDFDTKKYLKCVYCTLCLLFVISILDINFALIHNLDL